MWFAVEGRFLPVVDEWDGPAEPSPAAYDEAQRLTAALAMCQRARTIPPPDVLRWLTADDRASIGLRRRKVAA